MKRNQVIVVVFILSVLLCMLSGCDGTEVYHESERDNNSRFEIDDDTIPENPLLNGSLVRPDIDMSKVSYASAFSEGLAFVQMDKSPERTYCINKKGKIVFTLTGDYSPAVGFQNGLAIIRKNSGPHKDVLCLCDTSGRITSAEDLDATYFYVGWTEMFADGYLFAVRETQTETGTVCALGVLDNEGSYIVEPSESMYELWRAYYYDDATVYYDGYLFSKGEWCETGRYLDLRTGRETTGTDKLFKKIKPAHKSDFWASYREQGSAYFYDWRYPQNTDSAVIGPIECDGTYVMPLAFQDGVAPFLYTLGAPGNAAGFFTLINEKGAFRFEPVKAGVAYPDVISDQGLHLVVSARNSIYKEKYVLLQLFDRHGLMGEMKYPIRYFTPTVSFADGVIQIFDEDDQFTFYGTDLEPLF